MCLLVVVDADIVVDVLLDVILPHAPHTPALYIYSP